MITLNDYLYSGNTVLKILHSYEADLRRDALSTRSQVDLAHCNFLMQVSSLLEHNEFLSLQSQRIREFYLYMVRHYPNLAFTFSGRIKSLIRAEGKFNGYVVEFIHDYYMANGSIPAWPLLKERLSCFRDLIAYRIVISLPKCNLKPGEDQAEAELRLLYEIANVLPEFLEERGFTAELANDTAPSPLDRSVRHYYRDYVANPKEFGYRSLHITFYDNEARCHTELQLRTKEMDDMAKIGAANHLRYEERQRDERVLQQEVPMGLSRDYDEARQRGILLQELDLTRVDVNMFAAYGASLINDGCGLFRGRLILPYEHLSRFQSDLGY